MLRRLFYFFVCTTVCVLVSFDSGACQAETDTSFPVFNDPSYTIEFHVLKQLNGEEDVHFATLSLMHLKGGLKKILFLDTLEIFRPSIELADYNGDGIKDILVLYQSSARSNLTYHLYLVNNKEHHVKRVEGFEEICNPEYDAINKFIISFVLTGVNYYAFYIIDDTPKVIDLGNGFDDDRTDVTNSKYKKAISRIRKQLGRE